MSEILEIEEHLADTVCAIVHLNRKLALSPDDFLLRLNIESIFKRFDKLEAEFMDVARQKDGPYGHRGSLAVRKWRATLSMIPEFHRPLAKAVTGNNQ